MKTSLMIIEMIMIAGMAMGQWTPDTCTCPDPVTITVDPEPPNYPDDDCGPFQITYCLDESTGEIKICSFVPPNDWMGKPWCFENAIKATTIAATQSKCSGKTCHPVNKCAGSWERAYYVTAGACYKLNSPHQYYKWCGDGYCVYNVYLRCQCVPATGECVSSIYGFSYVSGEPCSNDDSCTWYFCLNPIP